MQGLEARGAQYFIQSAGSPSITISLTQADKDHPYFAYLHQYFAKVFRDNLKKETVVIGSNYSVFGKGANKLQAVTKEDSSLLTYGAQNIAKGYMDMIGLAGNLLRSLFPLKFARAAKPRSTIAPPAIIAWNSSSSNLRSAALPSTPLH